MPTIVIEAEAQCTRHAKLAGGGIAIGFRIHADDAWAVQGIDPGKRYQLAIVEIGDDELPVQQPQEAPTTEQQQDRSFNEMPASAPNPARALNRLTRQAVMACKEPWFRLFLEKRRPHLIPTGCHINTEKDARDVVCYICDVDSRSKILPGSAAAIEWNRLYSEAIAWKEVPEFAP